MKQKLINPYIKRADTAQRLPLTREHEFESAYFAPRLAYKGGGEEALGSDKDWHETPIDRNFTYRGQYDHDNPYGSDENRRREQAKAHAANTGRRDPGRISQELLGSHRAESAGGTQVPYKPGTYSPRPGPRSLPAFDQLQAEASRRESVAADYSLLAGNRGYPVRYPQQNLSDVDTRAALSNPTTPQERAMYNWARGKGQPEQLQGYVDFVTARAGNGGDIPTLEEFTNHRGTTRTPLEHHQYRLDQDRREGRKRYPIDYDRAQSNVPVFAFPDGGGDRASYIWYQNDDKKHFPGSHNPFIQVPETYTQEPLDNWTVDRNNYTDPGIDIEIDANGRRRSPGTDERSSAKGTLLHEGRHDLVEHRSNFSDMGRHPLLDDPAMAPRKWLGPYLSDPGFLQGFAPKAQDFVQGEINTLLDHGLIPSEQLGWGLGMQHEMYRDVGSRLETEADAREAMELLINDEGAFLQRFPIQNKEVLRGMRHFRRAGELIRHIPDPAKRASAQAKLQAYFNRIIGTYETLAQRDTPGQPNPYTADPRERSSGPGNPGTQWGAIT